MKKPKQVPLASFQGTPLEVHCKFCDGTGKFPTMPTCPHCGGVGSNLTEAGHELIFFVARRLSLKVEIGLK